MKIQDEAHSFGHKLRESRIAFTIRDDDICYFTEPWMLETVYEDAWKMGFKVSLAVIPYAKAVCQRQIPKKFQGIDKIFPISDNKELVTYLKEKLEEGCIDIVQHGCTHERVQREKEFAINNFELLDEKLRKGRKLLSETFNMEINVFVAPHEKISRAAWKALIKNEMSLCRKLTLSRLLLIAFPKEIGISDLIKVIFKSPNPFKPILADVIDLSKILVIQWGAFLAEPNVDVKMENARKDFEKHLHKGGVFVVAHHYWEYFSDWTREGLLKDRLAKFNEFLKYVDSKSNVWKTTLNEIHSSFKERKLLTNQPH